jgi:hypothetical protein
MNGNQVFQPFATDSHKVVKPSASLFLNSTMDIALIVPVVQAGHKALVFCYRHSSTESTSGPHTYVEENP